MKKYVGNIVNKNGAAEFVDMPQEECEELQRLIDQDKASGDLESIIIESVESLLSKTKN